MDNPSHKTGKLIRWHTQPEEGLPSVFSIVDTGARRALSAILSWGRGKKCESGSGRKAALGTERSWRDVCPPPLTLFLEPRKTHSTTVLTVRHNGVVAMGGDGQVTVGNSIMKADAVKIRRLLDDQVITGFAGSSADAFALLERFEAKLKDHRSNIARAAIELAKEWRTDRALRRLEAMLAVVDAEQRCW